jgi:Ca2+-binding EF-hand superfamily protein
MPINRPLSVATTLTLTVAIASSALGADEAMPKSSAEAEMKIMDTNHDGKITAMEHTVGAKKMFEMMDANQNGMVTASEMDMNRRQMMGAHGPKPEMSSAQKIKVVDKDQDGELSSEEHFSASRQMFDEMDSDGDRALTLAEIKAGHDRLMNAQANDAAD